MDRRSFLKGLAAVPVVAAVPSILHAEVDPLNTAIKEVQKYTVPRGKVINSSSFSKALWPGIDQWYSKAYSDHSAEYDKLFK